MTTIREIENGYLINKGGKETYYYSTEEVAAEIPGLDSRQLSQAFEKDLEVSELMIQTSINFIPVSKAPEVDASDLIESIVKWKEEFHNMHNKHYQRDVIRDLLIKHGVTKGE